MNEIIRIKSNNNKSFVIQIFEKSLLYIYITNIECKPFKNYKKIFALNDLKNLSDNKKDNYLHNCQNISELTKNIISNKSNIKLNEIDKNELQLIIPLLEPFYSTLKINFNYIFEKVVIQYYIVTGIKYQRMFDQPFVIYLNNNKYIYFNLDILKSILQEDKINIYNIDNYKYYNEDKKGFIKINESKNYPIVSNKLILEIHFIRDCNPILLDIKNIDNNIKNKIKKIKEKRNLLKKYYIQNSKYDLIYLYASPLINKQNIEKTPINYRSEIKTLLNLFHRKYKQYNCIFECANEKIFRNFLTQKTKILHITSHGELEEKLNDFHYSLILENRGIEEPVNEIKLKKILKNMSDELKHIDLVYVSTCYSETLGKLFYDYGAKNVIYIHGMTPISDIAVLKFSEYFYEELIKGQTIKDSFNRAQEKIQSNRKILYINPNNCCCKHKHKNKCSILKSNTIKSKIHKEYHIKICGCNYSEFNIHKKNCKLIQKIEINKNEYNFKIIEINNNLVKICCCCCEAPHNESSKFNLKSRNNYEYLAPFATQISGELQKNNNCCVFNFDSNKFFSTIGRKVEMKEICDILYENNTNNIHIIIIYGDMETGKQDFAESICVFLYERKIITSYYYIEIKAKLTKLELSENLKRASNYHNKINGKIIYIIKISYILDEEKSEQLLNHTISILEEISIINNDYTFLVLFSTQNDEIIVKKKTKNIHLKELEKNKAYNFLVNICESIDYGKNLQKLKNDNIMNLLEMIKYQPKKINYLAELICGEPDFEKMKEIIKSSFYKDIKEENKFEEIMKSRISSIYYLLSIMYSGLPISIINLIFENLDIELKLIKNDLFYITPEDEWYHLNVNYRKKIHEYFNFKINDKKECISKCIKIYARLLYLYIEKTKKNTFFQDSNIHYVFNSYNSEGIWKTFDEALYEYCFLYEFDKNEYNIILKKKFIINKHKDNIIHLIEDNLDYIYSLINNKDIVLKEYLEQLLLMLPSSYFLKKECKNIIKKCIYLSEQLNLNSGKKRLQLFLYSLEANPVIEPENFGMEEHENEGKAEAYFIKGLKNNDIHSFEKVIENYNMMGSNQDINKRVGYAKYEIAALFYKDKNYKLAEKILNEAKSIFTKIGDKFLINRCDIDLIMINQKYSHNYEEYKTLFNDIIKIIKESDNPYIKKEAYDLKIKLYKNLEPDIYILNSNPLNSGISVLQSGIFAYLNNQYYLLKKMQEKIKLNIKVKSIVLNKKNLEEAFNKEGKILIIQSDDFTRNGEIILESDIGQSIVMSNNELNLEIIPKVIKYKVIILCFINSSKLINLLKDKVEYLVTFDAINLCGFNSNTLLRYNQLSIDFLIDFIEKTAVCNIEDSFEFSKKNFTNKLNEVHNLNIDNYITLTMQDDNGKKISSLLYEKNLYKEKDQEIFLYYPFPNLPDNNLRNKDFSDEIFDIIKQITKNIHDLINIYIKNDNRVNLGYSRKINKKTLISIEIMRFLYRHQQFNELFYVFNPKKYGSSLTEISDNIMLNSKSEGQSSNSAFILINNFERIKPFKYLGRSLELNENVCYLVMSKREIILNVDKNKYNESDKKYKNKILVDKSEYKILKKCLEPDIFSSKKNTNKDLVQENNHQIDNKIFEDISIFNKSFDSEKTWSSKNESDEEI